MKESVALAKEADAKKEFSPNHSSKIVHRVRDEPERQLGSLRSVINNIRRDGGTPSVDSIATELSGIHAAQRAPALLALQRTHGNRYVQRVVSGIQAKLKVGQPGDKYEREADRVADEVMWMPEPEVQRQVEPEEEEEEEEETLQAKPLAAQITPLVQRQVEPEEEEPVQTKPVAEQITPLVQRQVEPEEEEEKEESVQAKQIEGVQAQRQEEEPEEEEEPIQTKQVGRLTSQASPRLEGQIRSLRGGGQPLSTPVRDFFEPRFGHDFTQVRVHADTRAAASARAVNARAFTVGRDIVFGAGYYTPETNEGRRLLAHELTHVVQQASDPVIRRDDDDEEEEISNIDRLEHLLEDDQEDEAIALMGRMRRENPDDVEHVLLRADLRNLAVSAFDNEEMYRAIRAMNGSLYEGLQWMFAEGTSWEYVRDVIPRAPGKARVRTDNSMKDHFINICNDEEMAEAVDLLGGTLLQKLRWMAAEGSNWDLAKTKLQDPTIPQTEKTDLYNHDSMKNFFVSVCNDEEMAEAVDPLGGTLLQKLRWMAAEGSNWDLVRTKIEATTIVIVTEKLDLYNHDDIRDFFVDVCNNRTIIIATRLLGGTWAQKTAWMEAEGVTAPVAGEMEEMLGEEARWVPSGPGSANTFGSWASAATEGAAPRLTRSTTINCWEMVLLAAYRCGVIDWNWIHNLYTAVSVSGWVSRMASSTNPYVPGTTTLSRGDLVFFNGLDHVALATGEGDRIYTFWPPPDNPSIPGTVDRVKISTIRALSSYMTTHFGSTPVVTYGTPAW